jgi:hypothetical protein
VPAAQRRASSQSFERGIAMWGPPGSGKTTFLAALSIALNRGNGPEWNIRGDDEASEKALARMTHELLSGRSFPPPTLGLDQYSWVLSGPLPGRRKLFHRERDDHASVMLELVDARGEIAGPDLEFSNRNEFIDGLVKSRGIVYIFDPMREFDEGDAFDHTFGMLIQLARRMDEELGWRGRRLPHHVAVCITKFDESPVYETADKMGLITSSGDRYEFPRVPDGEDARDLFMKLSTVSGSGNAEMVINSLERYFDPRRIQYFVTSAIGFYVAQGGKYDADDPRNVLPSDEIDPRSGQVKPRIRGPVHPINIIEPVFWLIKKLMDSEAS